MNINKNYASLKESYLFSEIGRKAAACEQAHPERELIRMGIGDVTRPLPPAVIAALQRASEEMGRPGTFRGYGPEQGYDFLREKIRAYYAERNTRIELNEIFISDGAKSDLGNILDLFDRGNTVYIPDPVYPVYVDTNLMDGRRVIFGRSGPENGFTPLPEKDLQADIIYLCSPNNPTGAAYDRDQLKTWVDYANRTGAVILYDAAYESFVSEPDKARSIFEVDGARTCAIEFCSLSKTAGFTGLRCGYTVVPEELRRDGFSLNRMWLRRQTTKFNGVSYVVQRAAEAVFTPEGRREIAENLNYYRENARVIASALEQLGIPFTGGKNAPYIWMRCPAGMDSWGYFDHLLQNKGIVVTPGAGFGQNGEGFVRLTAFSSYEKTCRAMERLMDRSKA